MLKKNKALILVVISMLLVSMFAFVGCAKKGTVGKEYDSAGLPLTKSAALKLWQGEWGYEDSNGYVSPKYLNKIDGNKYLVRGVIDEIQNGKNLDYYRNMYAEAEVTYDSKTRTLVFKRIFSDTTVVDNFHFVSAKMVVHDDSAVVGHNIYFKVK